MVTAAVLLLAYTDPVPYLLGRVAETHGGLKSFRVEATKTTVGPISTENDRFTLVVGEKLIDIDWVGAQASARWTLGGGSVRHLAPKTRQYTEEPLGDRPLLEAARAEASGLESFVFTLLDPSSLAAIFREIDPKGWRVETRPTETLLFKGTGLARDVIGWDRRSRLLTRYGQSTDRFGVDWRMTLTPGSIKPKGLPEGAYKVSKLALAVAPPVFASRQARQVTEALFARFDRPRTLGYSVTDGASETKVRIDGTRVWQRDAAVEWSYDGKALRLKSGKEGWAYDGPATISEVIDAVARAGGRVDPVLRALVTGSNPYRTLLGQGSQVTLVGTTSYKGDLAHLVQAKQGAGQATLVVRAKDSFVLSTLFTGPDGLAAPTKTYTPDIGQVPVVDLPAGLRRVGRSEATGRD